jgi:feruloyl-CoA synthase
VSLEAVADAVRMFNQTMRGAKVARVMLLDVPPRVDAHELSDKGSINRRAVIDSRTDEVARLFAEPPGDGVVVI